jgi:hypothetical protein
VTSLLYQITECDLKLSERLNKHTKCAKHAP